MSEKVKAIIGLVAFIAILVIVAVFLNQTQNLPKENTVQKATTAEKNIIEVNEENFEDEVLNSNKKVLIDFYAVWCGPCRIIKPRINEVATENPEIKVVEIDVDKCSNLASKYGVYSIPTLVVIENEEEINRVVGAVEKDKILEICGLWSTDNLGAWDVFEARNGRFRNYKYEITLKKEHNLWIEILL